MNVYDFDNTIYDGESCFDLFKFYLKKRPSLIFYMPRMLYAFARYKRGKISVEEAMNRYAPKIEEFFASVKDPLADVREFWDGKMHKIKPFYKSQQRPDDLIITASPDFTMTDICGRLGIEHCISSTVDMKTGKITNFCMRSNKIKAFFQEYPDTEIENFYTDSPENDKPLIDIAKNAFIVKGDKITQVK